MNHSVNSEALALFALFLANPASDVIKAATGEKFNPPLVQCFDSVNHTEACPSGGLPSGSGIRHIPAENVLLVPTSKPAPF